jgi:hypothetical protein
MLNGVSPTLFRVSRQSGRGDVNELLRDPRRIAGIAAKVDQQKTPDLQRPVEPAARRRRRHDWAVADDLWWARSGL